MNQWMLRVLAAGISAAGMVSGPAFAQAQPDKANEQPKQAARPEKQGEQAAAHEQYACPMHCEPGKAYPEPGRCPVCKMKLKPVSAMSYESEVRPVSGAGSSGAIKAGEKATLAIKLTDPTGAPVKDLKKDGAADAHVLFIASGIGTVLQQGAAAAEDGSLKTNAVLPAGEYAVVLEFLPAQGPARMSSSRLRVEGPPLTSKAPASPDLKKVVQDYSVSLEGADSLAAGKDASLTLSIALDGKPVALEPVLGDPARLIIASADLVQIDAATATDPKPHNGASATTVPFRARFEKPGLYRVWAEFRAGGAPVGVPLVVKVS